MPGQHMIDHEGIVEQVRDSVAHVKINCESACAACHAKGVCGAADREERYLDIPVEDGRYAPGEPVRVLIARSTGLKAVALGYIYPFVMLMAVLTGLVAAGVGEMRAGLIALGSLVPYYLALFLLRKRISNAFTFTLKKMNPGS